MDFSKPYISEYTPKKYILIKSDRKQYTGISYIVWYHKKCILPRTADWKHIIIRSKFKINILIGSDSSYTISDEWLNDQMNMANIKMEISKHIYDPAREHHSISSCVISVCWNFHCNICYLLSVTHYLS